MNMVSLASVDMRSIVFKDNLKLKEDFESKENFKKIELLLTRLEELIAIGGRYQNTRRWYNSRENKNDRII